jgi:hypothetical protein
MLIGRHGVIVICNRNQPSGFRDFLEIDQPETITAYGYSVSEVKIF